MGRVHTEGIRRLGNVEVAAIAASSDEKAQKFGEEVGVGRTTGDYRTVLSDATIDAVHICTPNALHFPNVEHPDTFNRIMLGWLNAQR